MIDITKLHIHYRDIATGKHQSKAITPSNPTNSLDIKKDIAEFVTRNKNKMEYYYVVLEIDRGGRPAFRTVIPKTFPKKDN